MYDRNDSGESHPARMIIRPPHTDLNQESLPPRISPRQRLRETAPAEIDASLTNPLRGRIIQPVEDKNRTGGMGFV